MLSHDYIGHHIVRQEGPRILTFYLYLNDVEAGGGTEFTKLGLVVTPKTGRAILWPSVLNEAPSVSQSIYSFFSNWNPLTPFRDGPSRGKMIEPCMLHWLWKRASNMEPMLGSTLGTLKVPCKLDVIRYFTYSVKFSSRKV